MRGLGACHAPHAGIVVCEPTPGGDTRLQLGADLLVALGKRPRTLIAERLRMRAWELAIIWLRAEDIKHLVILRAHLLGPQRWSDLIELSTQTDIKVWLVVHGPRPRVPDRSVLAQCATPVPRWTWEIGRDDLEAYRELSAPHQLDQASFPLVPDVDFPLFRSAARKILTQKEFEVFDQAYCAAFDAAAEELPARTRRSGTGRDLIQRLTVGANSENEVITRLRAAQAAFFGDGLLICIDLRSATQSTVRTPTEPLLPDHVITRLRMLASPEAAAVMTLARATGLSSEELAHLYRKNIAEDDRRGVSITCGHYKFYIPPKAAAPILAQLYYIPLVVPSRQTLFGRWTTEVHWNRRFYSSRSIDKIRNQTTDYIGVESRLSAPRDVPIVDVATAFLRE